MKAQFKKEKEMEYTPSKEYQELKKYLDDFYDDMHKRDGHMPVQGFSLNLDTSNEETLRVSVKLCVEQGQIDNFTSVLADVIKDQKILGLLLKQALIKAEMKESIQEFK